jgi:hypothetical protein
VENGVLKVCPDDSGVYWGFDSVFVYALQTRG